MFHDPGNGFLAYIFRHCCGNIFLETVQADSVADIYELQDFWLLQLILINAISIGFVCTKVIYNICCWHILLFLVKAIDLLLTEYVCHKSKTLCFIRHRKLIFIIGVQNNTEIADNRVSIALNNLYDLADLFIKLLIFLRNCVIFPVVFDSHGIGQLVVSQKLTVPVIDISSCSLYRSCFLDLKPVIIQIGLTVYNLQLKTASSQNCK